MEYYQICAKAFEKYESELTKVWCQFPSLWNVNDDLIDTLKFAFHKKEETKGQADIVGFLEPLLNDKSYVPDSKVVPLYTALLEISNDYHTTCNYAEVGLN